MSRKLIIRSAIPAVLIIVAAFAFAIFEPIQVLPRIRLSPGFLLVDQDAQSLTSEDVRGDIVLYTFGYTGCGELCDTLNATMREVQTRLDEVDIADDVGIRFVSISFDPEADTPEVLDAYATSVGADGEQWAFATAEPDHLANVVKAGFKTYYEENDEGTFSFDPAFVLVDGWGVVRGEYRYQTNASDADKILHHLDILGEEIRNAHGAAGLAYEAAHFFLCYP
ncbi:MAG: SCO family protein [Actinomycetota bacterium]|nr:SCO family protein [Actinomycetota bacterium]